MKRIRGVRLALLACPLLLAAALALAGCGGKKQVPLDGAVIDPPTAAPGFALRDQAGRTVTVAAQRGHWFVVTFLYTHCPDVCPLIAANLNGALRSPTGRNAGLRVLAVSVDPARDTPAAVRRYVAQHRLARSFHYLIGSPAELRRVWRAYHVVALAGPRQTVSHSSFELLVDPEGRERLIYDANVKTAGVVHDLRALD
jgi:protein SCO1/2